MRKIFITFLIMTFFSGSIFGFEKEKAVSIYKEKLIIADFANNTSWNRLGKGLTDDLTALFVKTKRFHIIEREKLQTILEEQELQLSGLINTEEVIKIGKIIGGKYIIYGSITLADASHSEKEIIEKTKDRSTGEIFYKKYIETTWEGRVTITARLVEIETGKILLGKSVTGKGYEKEKRSKNDKSFLEHVFSSTGSRDDERARSIYNKQKDRKVINTARQKAALKLVEDFLKEFPLSGYIISKTEDDDYLIDLGTGNGMNSKVNLEIQGNSEKIIHPVTKKVLKVRTKKFGYLKIIELSDNASTAKLVRGDDDEIHPGLKVQVVDPIFVWHRALASFVFPGSGQMLEKRWGSGMLFFLGEAALIGTSYYFYYRSTPEYLEKREFLDTTDWTTSDEKGDQYKKARNQALAGMWVFLSLEIFLHIWDTIDAGYPAEKNDVFVNKRADSGYRFSFLPNKNENRFYLKRSFRF